MRKVIGLILGILMVVAIVGSIGVVAASGVEVNYATARVPTWYYGTVLSTSAEVSARNQSSVNPAYARTILCANNLIVIRGASVSLTRTYVTVSSGWVANDSSKSYSGSIYGRVSPLKSWDFYKTFY